MMRLAAALLAGVNAGLAPLEFSDGRPVVGALNAGAAVFCGISALTDFGATS